MEQIAENIKYLADTLYAAIIVASVIGIAIF